ncbi:hypothetical protein CYY_002879 [Polysphondylium violaceum]|uniref:EF-hand domain-containing protein n=1 Tax=Polysphondylium violaceum TaxID=133409 RepID=A0A8J4UUR3_9MYCE|nr:hypothetical protein CYY_002879 [Polysphondylium violaceum]
MGAGSSTLSSSDVKSLANKTKYTKEEIARLQNDFKTSFDKDNSGGLNFDEFKQAFRTRLDGWSDAELTSLFNCFDADKNGKLDVREFIGALYLLTAAPIKEKLECLFDVFDNDKSGFLDIDELVAARNLFSITAIRLGSGPEIVESYLESTLNFSNTRMSKADFVSTLSGNDKFVRLIGLYPSLCGLLY